jgi:type II protein arginine methyltransferase
MNDDLERTIATFEAALRGRPDYAYHLVGVAETVAARKAPLRAAALARQAIAAAPGDPAVRMRARRLLGSLLPGYHVPMMNDARRNRAWDGALRALIRPGMLVLEIGTGAGMLALMAARAGARVVTCETNEVAAALAVELAARNGLADRIEVIAEHSRVLRLGTHLDRPADLLICDIFSDELLSFDPLSAIADARERLLAPGAACVPRAASLRVALARWRDYARTGRIDEACGFDLRPFADLVPAALGRPIDVAGLELLSTAADAFRFEFPAGRPPTSARRSFTVTTTGSGEANVLARWIRLELDGETVLEARPEPGGTFFSGLTLSPLDAPLTVEAGDAVTIGAAHNRLAVNTWVGGERRDCLGSVLNSRNERDRPERRAL